MKTAVIYYSYTGKTRALAQETAQREQAELIEVKERKNRTTLGAYVAGSFAAMRQKKSNIQDVPDDLTCFERIMIMVPLWAGYPAPAFNSILELLPKGSSVEITITSGSGNSQGSKDKTMALVAAKGVKIQRYEDVKTT